MPPAAKKPIAILVKRAIVGVGWTTITANIAAATIEYVNNTLNGCTFLTTVDVINTEIREEIAYHEINVLEKTGVDPITFSANTGAYCEYI